MLHLELELKGRLKNGIQTEVSAMTMTAAFQRGLMVDLGLF